VRDEDAKEIFDRARAKLVHLDGIENEFAADARRRDNTFEPLRHVCPTEKRTTQKETQEMTQDWTAWDEWCRGIAKEVVGELADEAGAATGQLEAELRQLRSDLSALKAELAVERAAKNFDNVFEIPSGFLRRKDATA
jgi:hypothetical protein